MALSLDNGISSRPGRMVRFEKISRSLMKTKLNQVKMFARRRADTVAGTGEAVESMLNICRFIRERLASNIGVDEAACCWALRVCNETAEESLSGGILE